MPSPFPIFHSLALLVFYAVTLPNISLINSTPVFNAITFLSISLISPPLSVFVPPLCQTFSLLAYLRVFYAITLPNISPVNSPSVLVTTLPNISLFSSPDYFAQYFRFSLTSAYFMPPLYPISLPECDMTSLYPIYN